MLTFYFVSQERKEINIKDAAKLYHEKEQEIKRKEQVSSDSLEHCYHFIINQKTLKSDDLQEKANPKNKGKKGTRRERTKTMKKVS